MGRFHDDGGLFLDSIFGVKDNVDATKIVKFQCSGITTATTRTLTIPDASGTIALAAVEAGFGFDDDGSLEFGTDDDVAIRLRSTILGANTALDDVIVGTPVTPAVAANSLLISNVTADGDFLVAANLGGNSQAWLWVDTSASLLTLFGAGVSAIEIGTNIVINEGSADRDFRIESNALANFLVIDANTCLNGQLALGGAVPTNPQAFFSILPAVNATGVTADQSYFHAQVLPGAAVTIPAGTAPVVASVNLHEPNVTATGTVSDACTLRIVDAPTEGTRNWALWVDAGSSRFDAAVIIGDTTTDAQLTTGIIINQGAADDNVMSFKSSDVDHDMTTDYETDTYGAFRKFAGADGGLKIVGLSDANVAVEIFAAGMTADATDPPLTSSVATITLNGAKEAAGTFGALGATENLLNVENTGTAEFVVKGDGELYSNQSATVGTFDDHDDALLAADLSHALSNEYGKILSYNERMLEEIGMLGPKDENGGRMYSVTKLAMLTLCAVGQLGRQIKTLATHMGLTVAPNGGLLTGGA